MKPSAAPAFMLDTNVFSRVLDGEITVSDGHNRRLLVTGVQADECRATRDPERRAGLLRVIEELAPELCLASSFCLGIEGAGFGQAEWNDGTGQFQKMLSRLQEVDRKPPRKHRNQLRDVVIAETAIKLGAVLVSDDLGLRRVVEEFGGQAVPSAVLDGSGPETAQSCANTDRERGW